MKNAVNLAVRFIATEIKARRGRGQRIVKSTGRYYTSEKRSESHDEIHHESQDENNSVIHP